MPDYLYGCKSCDVRTIIPRPIQYEEEKPRCYVCDQSMVRVYNFGSVKFNGSGFYSNESKGEGGARQS